MLIQFTLRNVLSFRNETTLDMTAISAYKEHPENLADIGTKEKFVRVAAIYGANASGKSNLYQAMEIFQEIIVESLNNNSRDGITLLKKNFIPFTFKKKNDESSEFQIVFILGENEYRYGFEYNSEQIMSEWLYRKSLKTNRMTMIFERTADNIDFGSSVRKECDLYKKQVPIETLVLSFFNKLNLNTTVFKDLYSKILSIGVFPTNFCDNPKMLKDFLPRVIEEDKENLIDFLNAIDSGIKDITYDDSGKEIEIYTIHQGMDGEYYPLNLYNESEGTIKSIALFIFIQFAIRNNWVLFVDELNIKLHPLLLKFIVDLFYKGGSIAQLIYTTHDTTLLDKKFFRRDQVWFVQKNEFGYSELIALSDFKVRSDASFEKDYLAGVYGGIPKLENFEMEVG